jgi:GNAT superfamily N-acetyltransferase
MTEEYAITTARPRDLAALPSIELAAARLLVGHAPPSVLTDVTGAAELADAQRQGRLWVALTGDEAVGFAHVKVIEPFVAHLEELDVHPVHGRRGLGTKLVMVVCAWAAAEGHRAVTLSTFRAVAWNMPFYSSLSFTAVAPEALTPALAAIVREESRRGLDPERRVILRRC